jgi:hypothetical protein
MPPTALRWADATSGPADNQLRLARSACAIRFARSPVEMFHTQEADLYVNLGKLNSNGNLSRLL